MTATNRARVLLAEDHADSRDAYSVVLTSCGFDVVVAVNGLEVLPAVRRTKPDVLVLDMGLPLLSGWRVLETLRDDILFADLPVIALTGHVYPRDEDRARDLGCDAFLAKPCPPDHLLAALRDVLAVRFSSAARRTRSKAKREEAKRLLATLWRSVGFGPECETLARDLTRLKQLVGPEGESAA